MSVRPWLLVMAAVAPGLSLTDELTGEIAIGYRAVSLDGDTPKYAEDVNLEEGPRLLQATVAYRPESGDGNGPDLVNIDLYGLGGDPFESARLEVRKYGQWHFTATRQRSDYVYEDILILPENASINGSTGGDYHHYDFSRVRDNVSLVGTLSERATATVDFQRYGRRGDSTTTLDIERDEFEMEKPIDEEMRLLRGIFRYQWEHLAVSVEERLREFESDSTTFLAGSSAGENPDNLTTLDNFFLQQPYEYRGHEHLLRVDAWPNERLELRFAAMFGNLDMSTTANETAQGTGYTGNPYSSDESNSVTADRDTNVFELDLIYALNDRFAVTGGVSRRDFEQFASDVTGGVAAIGSDWDVTTNSVEAGLQFAANRELSVSVGWYADQRDVRFSVFPTSAPGVSPDEKTSTDGFYAMLDYRPDKHLSLRASINETDIDDPFTLAAPADVRRYRLRARYTFDSGLAFTGSHSRTDSSNARSNWGSDVRQTVFRTSYSTARWQLSAGISDYDASRRIDRTVIGGSRQDLFGYTWSAQSASVDASLVFKANERWTIGGAYRQYDNDGSIAVRREELSGFAVVRLPQNYALRLNLRQIDFNEDNIESYDARIVEAALLFGF